MTEQFGIKRDREVAAAFRSLAMIVGQDYFSFAICDDAGDLLELRRFSTAQTNTKKLDDLLEGHSALNEAFSGITTAFDFDTNTLLPVDLNTGDNTPLLYLNQSGQQDHIIHEVVKEWALANVYSVPYDLLNWVLTHFPSSKFWHIQSVQIKNVAQGIEAGNIDLEVLDKRFHVTVAKDDRLLLAQQYPYASPADILFYLLKICETYALKQEEVRLNISGLIDQNSALYKTLYDYFLNVHLKTALWRSEGGYPAHYFTILNQVALCES